MLIELLPVEHGHQPKGGGWQITKVAATSAADPRSRGVDQLLLPWQ
jgi:hypothetical protein